MPVMVERAVLSESEREILSKAAAEMGRRGGIASRDNQTPEQRTAAARRAAIARWKKAGAYISQKAKKKARDSRRVA